MQHIAGLVPSGESQQSSIDLQIRYYTALIQTNTEWEFAGVFYDYKSGLRKEKRNGLDTMLKKAYRGEIDYIVTKSISRLSRNVLDTLTIIQWGYKRKFESGDDFVGKIPMGYKRNNNEWIVVPEELIPLGKSISYI